MTETLTPQRRIAKPHTLPREVTVADVLERAAYLYEEEIIQWGQRAYVCTDGARCMWGAVALSYGQFGLPHDGIIERAAEDFVPDGLLADVKWNDAPGRTKAEVVSALRAAASSARTKEEA